LSCRSPSGHAGFQHPSLGLLCPSLPALPLTYWWQGVGKVNESQGEILFSACRKIHAHVLHIKFIICSNCNGIELGTQIPRKEWTHIKHTVPCFYFFLISFRPHTVHGIWHGVAPMSPEPLRLIRGRSGPSDGPGPPTTAGCLLPSHPLPWGRADLQLEQADGLGALAAQCSEEVTALAVGQRALLEVCGIAGLGA
jgi:hypothetical protein